MLHSNQTKDIRLSGRVPVRNLTNALHCLDFETDLKVHRGPDHRFPLTATVSGCMCNVALLQAVARYRYAWIPLNTRIPKGTPRGLAHCTCSSSLLGLEGYTGTPCTHHCTIKCYFCIECRASSGRKAASASATLSGFRQASMRVPTGVAARNNSTNYPSVHHYPQLLVSTLDA